MKKIILFYILLTVLSLQSYACLTCNRPLQKIIAAEATSIRLFQIFLPFIILVVVVICLWIVWKKFDNKENALDNLLLSKVPLVCPSVILGIGIGGFIDGIVFHQILQWHEMLSNKIPPDTLLNKSANMFWDGIFHAFTLLVTLTGIWMLYRLLYVKYLVIHSYLFSGGLLIGWGLFNLIEGTLNHHIFELHHVRDLSPYYQYWNYGFLLISVIILLFGWILIKKTSPRTLNDDKHETWRSNTKTSE